MTFDMDGPFSASQKASWRTCTGKRPAISAGVHYLPASLFSPPNVSALVVSQLPEVFHVRGERKVDKRIDTFLKIRTAVQAGEFDPGDLDLGDPELQAACRQLQETASESDPPTADDRCFAPAADSISSGDEHAHERHVAITAADADGQSASEGCWYEAGYDDECFLRNEANRDVMSVRNEVLKSCQRKLAFWPQPSWSWPIGWHRCPWPDRRQTAIRR